MSTAKRPSPLRVDAILTDENGRKWRILRKTGSKLPTVELEPDHANCPANRPCTHYGETYL